MNDHLPTVKQWNTLRGLLHMHKWEPGDTVASVTLRYVVRCGFAPEHHISACREMRTLARNCFDRAKRSC